jgi:hypothetical protein
MNIRTKKLYLATHPLIPVEAGFLFLLRHKDMHRGYVICSLQQNYPNEILKQMDTTSKCIYVMVRPEEKISCFSFFTVVSFW